MASSQINLNTMVGVGAPTVSEGIGNTGVAAGLIESIGEVAKGLPAEIVADDVVAGVERLSTTRLAQELGAEVDIDGKPTKIVEQDTTTPLKDIFQSIQRSLDRGAQLSSAKVGLIRTKAKTQIQKALADYPQYADQIRRAAQHMGFDPLTSQVNSVLDTLADIAEQRERAASTTQNKLPAETRNKLLGYVSGNVPSAPMPATYEQLQAAALDENNPWNYAVTQFAASVNLDIRADDANKNDNLKQLEAAAVLAEAWPAFFRKAMNTMSAAPLNDAPRVLADLREDYIRTFKYASKVPAYQTNMSMLQEASKFFSGEEAYVWKNNAFRNEVLDRIATLPPNERNAVLTMAVASQAGANIELTNEQMKRYMHVTQISGSLLTRDYAAKAEIRSSVNDILFSVSPTEHTRKASKDYWNRYRQAFADESDKARKDNVDATVQLLKHAVEFKQSLPKEAKEGLNDVYFELYKMFGTSMPEGIAQTLWAIEEKQPGTFTLPLPVREKKK